MEPLECATSGKGESQVIIQKFGGTSLGKFSLNIVDSVIEPYSKIGKVVAVCSARSLDTKSRGTTNRLLRAARYACEINSESAYTLLIHDIQADHISAVSGAIRCPDIARELIKDITKECQHVLTLLMAATTLGEVSHRCVDSVVSAGEKLSAKVLCALLQDRGVSAAYVDLCHIISNQPSSLPVDQDFYDGLAARLGEAVQACPARVVVVTGFFGRIPCGLLNMVGRGYTDLCAALIAAGIPGSQLQIWKELDGIFSADPGTVTTARLLRTISPAEAAELTFQGSEVIQPLAMKQALRKRIPIMVKGVMNPQGPGSLVTPNATADRGHVRGMPERNYGLSEAGHKGRALGELKRQPVQVGRPISITKKRGVIMVGVHSTEQYMPHSFFVRVFATLEKWRLAVNLVSTSGVHLSMALESKAPELLGDAADVEALINEDLRCAIHELRMHGRVQVVTDMAIVSIIGHRIRENVSLTGDVFATLGSNNIHVAMISQGASETSMSFVISEENVERAISILHDRLFSHMPEKESCGTLI
ncbi:aspartokinase [Xylariales sp. PMI_506]|nr:aspartokinase [Xylariales sp. PMI_506]